MLDDSNIVTFVAWSVITCIIMGVAGLSYKVYLGRNKNETPAS